MAQGLEVVILAIILGTLLAIVYSLRVLVLMERRIARIDLHIEALVTRVLEEEKNIEDQEKRIMQEEKKIEAMLTELQAHSKPSKKVVKKAVAKTTKKSSKKATKKKKK